MSSQDAVTMLGTHPAFAALPARELEAFDEVTIETSYRAREYVPKEGHPALWSCVVKPGRVKILRQSRAGKDVALDVLGPGDALCAVAEGEAG
jgi:CRP-like cAMP-binding protein